MAAVPAAAAGSASASVERARASAGGSWPCPANSVSRQLQFRSLVNKGCPQDCARNPQSWRSHAKPARVKSLDCCQPKTSVYTLRNPQTRVERGHFRRFLRFLGSVAAVHFQSRAIRPSLVELGRPRLMSSSVATSKAGPWISQAPRTYMIKAQPVARTRRASPD